MQPHGKVLLVIGIIGTVLILAFSSVIMGSKPSASAEPPAQATATAVVATPTAIPSPTAIPTIVPTPAPAPVRQDCNAIRGSEYRSAEERSWFLANCS